MRGRWAPPPTEGEGSREEGQAVSGERPTGRQQHNQASCPAPRHPMRACLGLPSREPPPTPGGGGGGLEKGLNDPPPAPANLFGPAGVCVAWPGVRLGKACATGSWSRDRGWGARDAAPRATPDADGGLRAPKWTRACLSDPPRDGRSRLNGSCGSTTGRASGGVHTTVCLCPPPPTPPRKPTQGAHSNKCELWYSHRPTAVRYHPNTTERVVTHLPSPPPPLEKNHSTGAVLCACRRQAAQQISRRVSL